MINKLYSVGNVYFNHLNDAVEYAKAVGYDDWIILEWHKDGVVIHADLICKVFTPDPGKLCECGELIHSSLYMCKPCAKKERYETCEICGCFVSKGKEVCTTCVTNDLSVMCQRCGKAISPSNRLCRECAAKLV